MTLSRRSLITGLVSFVAAPAIVRATSIMPVKAWTIYPLYGASPARTSMELLREQREYFNRVYTEMAELIADPPHPMIVEIQAKRVEFARFLSETLKRTT